MLENASVMGFIPTRDFKRARAFYIGLLGLTLITEDSFAIQLDSNGTRIRISKVDEFTPYPFTILGWQVPDIVSILRALSAKGLAFQRYPWLQQDEVGIWTAPSGAKVAWFHDPDGNTLSFSQHP
jgi:catechol 2,3-dioxygenase-like lactoylglutathione lyase family enzyme